MPRAEGERESLLGVGPGVEEVVALALTEPHLHVVALLVFSEIHRVRLPRIADEVGHPSSLFGGHRGVDWADSVRLCVCSRSPLSAGSNQ